MKYEMIINPINHIDIPKHTRTHRTNSGKTERKETSDMTGNNNTIY